MIGWDRFPINEVDAVVPSVIFMVVFSRDPVIFLRTVDWVWNSNIVMMKIWKCQCTRF